MEEHPQAPVPPEPPPSRKPKKRSLFLPMILLFLGLFLMVIIVGVVFLVSQFKAPTAVSAPKSGVVHVQLGGMMPEYVPPNGLDVLTGVTPYFFYDYLQMIEKAKNDPKVSGMYLEIYPLAIGYAQVQELADAFVDFKSSGKWLVTYGEIWTEKELMLGAVADELYVTPESIMMLDGFMSRVSFYQEALDWAGIKVDVAAFKEYKNFADPYRKESMSEPQKQALTELLEGVHGQFVDFVASAREIPVDRLQTLIEQGCYDGGAALEAGLVDGLFYEDQVYEVIAEKAGLKPSGLKLVQHQNYFIPNHREKSVGANQIALLLASGSINSGNADRGAFGDPIIGSDWVIEQIRKIRKSPQVKAVVLRIDSPGGSALASDVMWRELQKLREEGIPVIASMGTVAASGGYYMAMGCDTIFADPLTITGSIGVVAMRFDMAEFYNHIKVHVDVVKTSPNADFFDPYRPLTDSEREAFLARTEQFYQTFVQKAADSRGVAFDELEPYARGRVWTGKDAHQHGLVDELGGLNAALKFAAQKAGVQRYNVRLFPAEKDFWTLLSEAQVHATPPDVVNSVIPPVARRMVDLNNTSVQQPMALLPFDIEIK